MAKILIVEDDKNILKLVRYNLQNAGFECLTAITGEDALEIIHKELPELIILDIMLPKMDGFEFLRAVKQGPRFKNVPIIILTAKAEETDRIVGLELGADDYITKPFSVRELLLRVKAVIKRYSAPKEESKKDILAVKNLKIDLPKHIVTINGKKINLTLMEFKLLVVLLERRGRLQTRERLLEDVWNMDSEVDTRTIDTHIKHLRKKLGSLAGYIETVRGMGYRFKEEGLN